MSELVVDTSVWISYFRGRDTELVDRIDSSSVATSALALAELDDVLSRKGFESKKHIAFIRTRCEVLPVDGDVALAGSQVKQQQRTKYPRFGIMDGMQYASAKHRGITFITHDKEFSGLSGVEIV